MPLIDLLRAFLFVGLCLASATAQQPPFERLPADATTVVYVGDVLPVVEQVIASPEVQKLLKALDPSMRKVLGMPLEAKRIKAQIGLARQWIPKQVVFACPASCVDTVLSSAEAAVLAVMLKQAVQHKVEEYEAEVRAGLASVFRAMKGIDAVLVVTMPTERAAENTCERLADLLSGYVVPDTEPVREGDVIGMTLAPFQHLAPSILATWSKNKVKAPKVLTEGFAVRLFQQGADVVAMLGQPKAGPLDPTIVGELWDPAKPPLVLSQVTPRIIDDAIRLRQLAFYSNSDDLLNSAKQIEAMSHPSAYSLHVGDEIHFKSEHKLGGRDSYWMARTAALARAVPEACSATLLSSSLHEVLLGAASWWDEFCPAESAVRARLPRSLQALEQQKELMMGARGAVLITSEQGAALVLASDGPDVGYMVCDELLDSLRQDLGLKSSLVEARDLGLAPLTLAVDLAALSPALASSLRKDAVLHFFEASDCMVFSTDASLSKQVIERLAKKAGPATQTLDLLVDADTLKSWLDQLLATGKRKRRATSPVLDAVMALLVRAESLAATGAVDRGTQREHWVLKLR